jgi:transposase
MARYKPVDRHLSKLLPVRFSEQILSGTFEYALNWLVDHEIDLTVFDARYRNDETGAAAYDPAVLLKIVLLGYARGLTSSRSIERACRENVVFMALSGDTQPHFTTIASFVARLPAEITAVFRDVLLVCDQQGLIGRELFAVDGCKLPSNASRTWSGTRAELQKKAEKMEQAVAWLLDTHRRQDAGQNVDPLGQREQQQIETLSRNSQKIRKALADFKPRLNRKGEELKSNLTDADSATMKTSHGVVQGYTGVAAVDAKSQVVLQASAYGTGQENSLLPAVLQELRDDFQAIGRKNPLKAATVLSDSGYHSEATLQQLADTGIKALVADTGFRSRDPRFAEAYRHKPEDRQRQPGERRSPWFQPKDFDYDPQARTCRCPNGSLLKLRTATAIIKGRRGVSFEGSRANCGACPLRSQCIRKPGVSMYRQVTFFDGTKTQDLHPQTTAMKARIDTREGRLLYSRRLGIVEPVFGNLHSHGLRRFTLRSRRKVDAQWKLFALVHNVQKLQGKAP